MALYTYQALSKDGKRVVGKIDASSNADAREQITKMGFYPIKIESTQSAAKTSWSWRSLFQRSIDIKDKIFFTKQLALLLKSGIPLLQALDLLTDQTEGGLQNTVISLKDDIKEGRSLADALERFPKTFDNTYVQLIRAGEASGKLDIILNRLTTFLEQRNAINRRVKSALSYPLFQLGFIFLIVGGLFTFVVPQIAGTLQSTGAALPWPTQFLLTASEITTHYYWLILIIIAAIYGAYRWWKQTEQGGRTLDTIKLKIPLVSYFSRMGTVVQFSRTLGMLIEGGVNLAEALFIVSKIIDNRILAQALNEARENIIKQGRIAEYLKKTNIFPPVAIYLINTGEQSGNLGAMLLTVSEYYETEMTDLAESLSSKLGPIMTIVMALIVGFIILAILLPILNQIEGTGLL
jgi:type II secretory pathway component PulF